MGSLYGFRLSTAPYYMCIIQMYSTPYILLPCSHLFLIINFIEKCIFEKHKNNIIWGRKFEGLKKLSVKVILTESRISDLYYVDICLGRGFF